MALFVKRRSPTEAQQSALWRLNKLMTVLKQENTPKREEGGEDRYEAAWVQRVQQVKQRQH